MVRTVFQRMTLMVTGLAEVEEDNLEVVGVAFIFHPVRHDGM